MLLLDQNLGSFLDLGAIFLPLKAQYVKSLPEQNQDLTLVLDKPCVDEPVNDAPVAVPAKALP